MFSSKKSDKKKQLNPIGNENRINEGTTIVGDIESSGFFRIDGTVEGNIKTPTKVVIGKTGVLKGTLHCDNADIEGVLVGDLKVTEMLNLRHTAKVDGNIQTKQLAIEPGAEFNANCVMKEEMRIVDKNENQQKKAK